MRLIALSLCMCTQLYSFISCKESQNCTSTNQKQVISLLSLLPYYNRDPSLNPSWNEGDNIQPALELAKDQINNSSAVLENYTLCLVYAEAGCNQVGRTTVSFVMHAGIGGEDAKVIGIIGPGCSASTIGLAPLTNRSEIGLVMVHGSGSPKLQDEHNKYRYLLGTLGSTYNFVRGFIYLLESANWKRIAILYDDSRLYHLDTQIKLTEEISGTLTDVKIEFSSPVSFTHLPLDVIKHSLIRIIYVLCPTELSQRIVCLSLHKNMTYSNYQWVFMSQTLEQLSQPADFVYEGVRYNCSRDDMRRALDRMFLMVYKLVPSDGQTPISNQSFPEYLEHYEAYREQHNINNCPSRPSEYTFWATYLYDVVWAWGLVLDNLTKIDGFELNDTIYGNINQTQQIVDQFYDTTFQGMSGWINFNRSTGFTDRDVNISQIINDSEVASKERLLVKFIEDSFPNVTIQESGIAGFVFSFIIFVQLLVNVCLHIITGFNFKQPSIKASSPNLLHMSYIGTYVLGAGALIYSLISVPSLPPIARCWLTLLLWAWFLPFGFTLAFSPVAMRTWRVYRIFVHYLNPGPLISDPILLVAIGLLLLADVIVGVTWTAFDPFRAEDRSYFNGASVEVKTVCNCKHYHVWFNLVVAHKVSLLVVVTALALLTRNIPNRSFTTDALRILAYIMSILFGLGFSLYYILHLSGFDPNDSFITILVVLNLMVCVFIMCIFVPPVVPVAKKFYKSTWQTSTVDKCSLETQSQAKVNM